MNGATGARPADSRYAGPADAALREQWRRERRALVRRHHPDAGGGAHDLQARMEALDRRYQFLERPGRRTRRARIPRTLHRLLRGVRRRRYLEL